MSEDSSDGFSDQPFDPKEEAQRDLARAMALCPIGVYGHRKGGTYAVFSHSVDETTLAPLVHYFSFEKHTRWTRTVENFLEIVDGAPRFRWVREATPNELFGTRRVE